MLGKKIFKGSALGIINVSLRTILGFISVPIVISYLGKEKYGLWLTTLSLVTLVNLFDAGIFPVVKNLLIEAYAINDRNKIKEYTSFILVISILILLLGVSLFPVLVYHDWASFFNANYENASQDALKIIIIIYLMTVISVSLSCIDIIYASQLKIVVVQLVQLVATVSSFFLVIISVFLKLEIHILILFSLIPSVILKGYLLIFYVYKNKFIFFKFNNFYHLFKQLVSKSSCFLGIKMCEIFISSIQSIYIAKKFNLEVVSEYNLVYRLVSIPLLLLASIFPVIWPAFTSAWVKKDIMWLKNKMKKWMFLSFCVFLIYGVFISLIGTHFILFWTKGIVKTEYKLIMLVSILTTIQGSTYWLSTFLHSVSEFFYQFKCYLFMLLMLIFISLANFSLNIEFFIFYYAAIWFIFGFIPMFLLVQKRLR